MRRDVSRSSAPCPLLPRFLLPSSFLPPRFLPPSSSRPAAHGHGCSYTRHDDLPDVYHEVCGDMWEADEEKMLEVLTEHANKEKVEEEERKAAASLCAQTFG